MRVLAATNVDLLSRIPSGEFRRDLYYRLNVIAVTLPPLRERGDDVLLLASHYLQKFGRSMGRTPRQLGPDALRALREHDWPGNVRELEHAIEHAMVLSQRDVIAAADLPFRRAAPFLEGATIPGVAPPHTPPPALSPSPALSPAQALLPARAHPAPKPPFSDLSDLEYPEAKRRLLASFDEAYTGELLRRAGGNMSEAARLAGLDRSNFRRLVKRHREH